MSETRIKYQADSNSQENVSIEIPPECCVVFYNDDFTTKDFVVEILMDIFHKAEAEAVDLMELVHKAGKAVVGIYTYDIALTRVTLATSRARKNGFPLKIEVEKE
ncbi:MAG: ATP-dependent Clp protease adaptor ClpS [Treponema sp.]|nr:ATP-dependent Clp protease adaptor ClpS [Treponema sp.]